MYIYDTRTKNHDTLPLHGWFFPCIICESITGKTIIEKSWKNMIFPITFKIPFCNKCKKNNKKIDYLDEEKIKYQN